MHGMYGTLGAEFEEQRRIMLGPTDNKRIIDVLWRGEMSCIGSKTKDADLWIMNRSKLVLVLDPNLSGKYKNAADMLKASQELPWTHDTSTPHRSQTHRIAEESCPKNMKVQQRRWCTVVCVKSGGTKRWNALVSCGTHTTWGRMAKPQMKNESAFPWMVL